MINCVIYDLDGTLVNSASVVQSILNRRRTQLNQAPLEYKELVPWLSLGGEELIAAALGVGEDQVGAELHNFREEYAANPTPINSLYPGVPQVLDYLKRADVHLAVCTNKPRNLAHKVLCETQILDYFTYVGAGGDLPVKKPHPQTLKVCLDFLGANPAQTLYIGDSLIDQQLCQALDIPFVHFLEGYDDGVDTKQTYYKIRNHHEIVPLLQQSTYSQLSTSIMRI